MPNQTNRKIKNDLSKITRTNFLIYKQQTPYSTPGWKVVHRNKNKKRHCIKSIISPLHKISVSLKWK